MTRKALIFDFDLTLADSSQGIFQCVNHAMQQMDYPSFEYDTIKKLIGYSLPDTFRMLTGIDDIEKQKEFTKVYVEHANSVMNKNTFIFPEVFDVIPKLKKQGFHMAIVSTKYRYRIEGILERDKLTNYFDYIIGGEDVKELKPNPEGLELAIQKLGVEKKNAIYIGDTLIDSETAQRAGVKFIGVLTGTTTEADFKTNLNGGSIIQDLNHLSNRIATS